MDIAARIATFFADAWERRTRSLAGEVLDAEGIGVFLTGVPAPWFNAAMVRRPPEDPDRALALARTLQSRSGLSFGIDLDPEAHAPVRAAAERAGLGIVESRPGMAMRIEDLRPPDVPDGLAVERVLDPPGLDEVAAIDAAAFGGTAEVTRAFVGDGIIGDPAQRAYLARIDGVPVACAETCVVDRVLGVFGVGTIPEHRRQGFAAVVTAHAIGERIDEVDLVTLQASKLGLGVYERLGFRAVSTWEVWGPPKD